MRHYGRCCCEAIQFGVLNGPAGLGVNPAIFASGSHFVHWTVHQVVRPQLCLNACSLVCAASIFGIYALG